MSQENGHRQSFLASPEYGLGLALMRAHLPRR
jgi:hypothetical protein